MDAKLHQKLVSDTEELRKLVGTAATEAVVGMCASYALLRYHSEKEQNEFIAPGKQPFFLIGLLLTTPEPLEPREFGQAEWQRAINLLNDIFGAYSWMFWPTMEEAPHVTEEWEAVRDVAMPAFLHYFNTGLLASVEQVRNRVKLYLSPFDSDLEAVFGISASHCLDIADWVAEHTQKTADDFQIATVEEREVRLALLDRAEREHWTDERMKQEVNKPAYLEKFTKLMGLLQSLMKVSLSDLRREFGSPLADAYWSLFVSKRGEVETFMYLTERNLAEERPLFQVSEGVAIFPLVNALYEAILIVGENTLIQGAKRDAFLIRRDKTLEKEVERNLRRLFRDEASYFSSVYENNILQFEHDLIIIWERKLFIVEAKAAPPVEPFRDPDKAYTRIKRAFQSDRGIQKAYNQANRLRRILLANGQITLYSSERQPIVTIQRDAVDDIFCICVTRDDFGALSSVLSILLERDEGEPYPWAVNILDLENIIDTWEYFSWGGEKFCEYLRDRRVLHDKVFSTDELDFVGFSIKHGGLHWLINTPGDRVFLEPHYSDFVDQIYFARKSGETVIYRPKPPVVNDMRQMLARALEERQSSQNPVRVKKKQGRNEPCACGSGKKYKRCCGK